MIRYRSGSILFILRWTGSVFPRTLLWSVSSGALAILCHFLLEAWDFSPHIADLSTVSNWWASMTTVLGFLIVFRTQQAHARYWEGATLAKQTQGELLDVATSLVAFCNTDPCKAREVVSFQHLLVRLMSILYSSGLQTISDLDDTHFRMLDWSGIEEEKMRYLALVADRGHRCQILRLWVQRLVVESISNGVLVAPTQILAPILKELSENAVHFVNAEKLTEVTFPFPYAQLISVLLLAHWVLTPVLFTLLLESHFWSPALAFASVTAFWGINYIACELESPFGDDPNDLDLAECADHMNDALWSLLTPEAQTPPTFDVDAASCVEFAPVISGVLSEYGYIGPSEAYLSETFCVQTSVLRDRQISGDSEKPRRKFHAVSQQSSATSAAFRSATSAACPSSSESVAESDPIPPLLGRPQLVMTPASGLPSLEVPRPKSPGKAAVLVVPAGPRTPRIPEDTVLWRAGMSNSRWQAGHAVGQHDGPAT